MSNSLLARANHEFAKTIQDTHKGYLLCWWDADKQLFYLKVMRHWKPSVELLVSADHAEIARMASNKNHWYPIAHNVES